MPGEKVPSTHSTIGVSDESSLRARSLQLRYRPTIGKIVCPSSMEQHKQREQQARDVREKNPDSQEVDTNSASQHTK